MNKLSKLTYTLAILLIAVFAKAQAPKSYTIENITVSGQQYLSAKAIIAVSDLQIGDRINVPGPEISNAVRKIWAENRVGNVSITASEINGEMISLNIALTERARLSAIYIEGIRKGEEKDLNEKFNLVTSQVISEALKKNITLNIERFFKEKGFYNVKVSALKETPDSTLDNHVLLRYEVDKGKKVKINQIVISGEEEIEEKKIKRKLKKTKEKKWWRLWHRSKYIQDEYKNDEQTVVALYRSLGMRDAQVNLDTVYNVDEKSVNLEVTIEEGKKYYFRDIVWSGNSKYTTKQLNDVLKINKGDLYNQSDLDSKLNFNPTGLDISSLYLDDGYLFFSVRPIELRVEGDSIDMEMRIYEGNQATIGNVKVYGNTKTSDHVIIRELRTLPGDKFSRSDLIQSQQIIASLGYFDPEQIQIIPIPNPQNGTVDIEYKLVEKPSDQLQLSGGWGGGGRLGFVGTLGLVFNNFALRNIGKPKLWDPLPSGDGQRLSIQAQANGAFFQNYSISFTEPWLGGKKPNSFTVALNHSLYGRFDTTGSLSISGATVSLGRRLTQLGQRFTLSNSLSYFFYNIDNFAFSNSSATLCNDCIANNLSFNTTLARNSAGPNQQFPTSGSNVSLSLSLTPPYSLFDRALENVAEPESFRLVEYNKWMFDFSSFLKLSGRKRQEGLAIGTGKKEKPLVLHTRFHFGYIGSYNSNVTLSPFERFRLGGTGINNFGFILGTDIISLRGYDEDALFPENGGGVIYNKLVWELRYPFVTEGIATVYGFGFFEAGNNWGDARDYNPLDMKRSTGLGLSLFMPAFGNISLGYGWGLDETPFNEQGQSTNGGNFLFSIGTILR